MNISVKGFAQTPECPFCGLPVEKPKEIAARRLGEMPVGSCSCGAVYACDVSGRNMGAAFIEALVFGCNMDWDLAWSLAPGEDYQEKLVERYDLESHKVVPHGSFEGRRIKGALYFVRLHEEIREVTGAGVRRKLEKAAPAATGPAAPPPELKPLSKQMVEELVGAYQLGPLIQSAGHNKRLIRDLQRLLYSGDELFRHRAADALGKVSAAIAGKDPGAVSNLLQRLVESISYPGASSWGAIDTIGEIIYNSPDLYMGYLPRLYQFLEDVDHRPRILRAMARAAEARPGLLRNATFRLLPFLSDPNPEARGYAVLIFDRMGAREAKNYLGQMTGDSGEINIYHDGTMEKTTVGRLAAEALERIGG